MAFQATEPNWKIGPMADEATAKFDFEVVYKKGKENVVADALSRIPEVNLISFDSIPTYTWYHKMITKVRDNPSRFSNWKFIGDKLFMKFETHSKFGLNQPWKLVVPESARAEVLRECHDDVLSGHFGVYKTKCDTTGLGSLDVGTYVKGCDICKI